MQKKAGLAWWMHGLWHQMCDQWLDCIAEAKCEEIWLQGGLVVYWRDILTTWVVVTLFSLNFTVKVFEDIGLDVGWVYIKETSLNMFTPKTAVNPSTRPASIKSWTQNAATGWQYNTSIFMLSFFSNLYSRIIVFHLAYTVFLFPHSYPFLSLNWYTLSLQLAELKFRIFRKFG